MRCDAHERITREHPQLRQALLTYVVGVMSGQLNFASKTMSLLRA